MWLNNPCVFAVQWRSYTQAYLGLLLLRLEGEVGVWSNVIMTLGMHKPVCECALM